MLNSADPAAFAPPTDLDRSRALYTDAAGPEFIEHVLTLDTLPQDTDKIRTRVPGWQLNNSVDLIRP